MTRTNGYDLANCPHVQASPMDVCCDRINTTAFGPGGAASRKFTCSGGQFYDNIYYGSIDCTGTVNVTDITADECSYPGSCMCDEDGTYGSCPTFTFYFDLDCEEGEFVEETRIKNLCIPDGNTSSYIIPCPDSPFGFYDEVGYDDNECGCKNDYLSQEFVCDGTGHEADVGDGFCGHYQKWPLNQCVEQDTTILSSRMFSCNITDGTWWETIWTDSSDCDGDNTTFEVSDDFSESVCSPDGSDYCNYATYTKQRDCYGNYEQTMYVDSCITAFGNVGSYGSDEEWLRHECNVTTGREEVFTYFDDECTLYDHPCPYGSKAECTTNLAAGDNTCSYVYLWAVGECNLDDPNSFLFLCDPIGQTYEQIAYFDSLDCNASGTATASDIFVVTDICNDDTTIPCNCVAESACNTALSWNCGEEDTVTNVYVTDECFYFGDEGQYGSIRCDADEGVANGVDYFDPTCTYQHPLTCDNVYTEEDDYNLCTYQVSDGSPCGHFSSFPLNMCSYGAGDGYEFGFSYMWTCSDTPGLEGNGSFTQTYYDSNDCTPGTEFFSIPYDYNDCDDQGVECYCPADGASTGCDIMQSLICDATDVITGQYQLELRVIGDVTCYYPWDTYYTCSNGEIDMNNACDDTYTPQPTTASPTAQCVNDLYYTGTCFTNAPSVDPTQEPTSIPSESPTAEPTTSSPTTSSPTETDTAVTYHLLVSVVFVIIFSIIC